MKEAIAMLKRPIVLSVLSNRSVRRRGFTLTEVAIVLGVMGIVMAALWTIFSTVSANQKVVIAVQEASFIAENYRGLYGHRGIEEKVGAITPVTCLGVADGFFPPTMVNPAVVCVDAPVGDPTTWPKHPWGDAVGVSVIPAEQSIQVGFNNLPLAACVQLATQIPDSATIFNVALPSTIVHPPITPTVAVAGCVPIVAGGPLNLQILYRAR